MTPENLQTITLKCRESDDEAMVCAAVTDILNQKISVKAEEKLQLGKCCAECFLIIKNRIAGNQFNTSGSVWLLCSLLDTLERLSDDEDLAHYIVDELGYVLISIPMVCHDSSYLKMIKIDNARQQHHANYLFLLLSRYSLSLLFSALNRSTSSVRRCFEKSLVQENIHQLETIAIVLKNEPDLDIKLSCTEMLWRALRRMKADSATIAKKLGFNDFSSLQLLKDVPANDFEEQASSWIDGPLMPAYADGVLLRHGHVYLKLFNDKLDEHVLGEYQIAKAVIGQASTTILLQNKARLEVPYYLVELFKSEMQQLSFMCEISGRTKPTLFDCWSEEAQRSINIPNTKNNGKITINIVTKDITENTNKILSPLRRINLKTEQSKDIFEVKDFASMMPHSFSQQSSLKNENIAESPNGETCIVSNGSKKQLLKISAASAGHQNANELDESRSVKAKRKKNNSYDADKNANKKDFKGPKRGKFQRDYAFKSSATNSHDEKKNTNERTNIRKKPPSKETCVINVSSISSETEKKNVFDSYKTDIEELFDSQFHEMGKYYSENKRKKQCLNSPVLSSCCGSPTRFPLLGDNNEVQSTMESDQETIDDEPTKPAVKPRQHNGPAHTFSQLSFDISDDILDNPPGHREDHKLPLTENFCDEDLHQVLTKIMSNKTKENAQNIRQIKEMFANAEKHIEKLLESLLVKQEKRQEKHVLDFETKLSTLKSEISDDTINVTNNLVCKLSNLVADKDQIKKLDSIPSALTGLKDIAITRKQLKHSLQQHLNKLKDEVSASEKLKKSTDPAKMIEVLIKKML